MENTATDYKKLYEQELQVNQKSLLVISGNEKLILKKEVGITGPQFELENFRKYLFHKKSENFTGPQAGAYFPKLF